jgi:lysophospholipase L1-like esterase
MMFRRRVAALLLMLGMPLMSPLCAQVVVPDDDYAADPVGIVEKPCVFHPAPIDDKTKAAWRLHLATRDFGGLCRYAADDARLIAAKTPVRIVFLGDSITEGWAQKDPALFQNGVVGRGIGGQTTPQMLVRFRQDVIDLHPKAVHIMAGTNDIAGNTGAATMATVTGNIRSMAELAKANGIRVVIASVPPAAAFPWAKDKQPTPQIAAINAWAKGYAAANGFQWVDYHPVLATAAGAMKPGLASDGVHPTEAGYAAMRPVALAAIARATR